MSDAEITLNGRLTADPVMRRTESGLDVVNFDVAHTPRRRNANGDWEDAGETLFMRVTAWRNIAPNIFSTLHKGDAVNVIGRLRQRSYEHNGETRKVIECDADIVSLDLRYASAVVTRNAPRAVTPSEPDAWAAPPTTRKSAAA